MLDVKNKNPSSGKDISFLKKKYPDVFPQWEDLVRARKNYEEALDRLQQANADWENL